MPRRKAARTGSAKRSTPSSHPSAAKFRGFHDGLSSIFETAFDIPAPGRSRFLDDSDPSPRVARDPGSEIAVEGSSCVLCGPQLQSQGLQNSATVMDGVEGAERGAVLSTRSGPILTRAQTSPTLLRNLADGNSQLYLSNPPAGGRLIRPAREKCRASPSGSSVVRTRSESSKPAAGVSPCSRDGVDAATECGLAALRDDRARADISATPGRQPRAGRGIDRPGHALRIRGRVASYVIGAVAIDFEASSQYLRAASGRLLRRAGHPPTTEDRFGYDGERGLVSRPAQSVTSLGGPCWRGAAVEASRPARRRPRLRATALAAPSW